SASSSRSSSGVPHERRDDRCGAAPRRRRSTPHTGADPSSARPPRRCVMSGLDTTSQAVGEIAVEEAVASPERLGGTGDEGEVPGQGPLAAPPYGAVPSAAAAASGWQVSQATDSTTSRKHPASFAVLAQTVERTATRATRGFSSYPSV